MKEKRKCKGIKDIYKFYQKKCWDKNITPQKTLICRRIWVDCNLFIKDLILKKSDFVQLPFRLGILRVKKNKINYRGRPENKLPIDWGMTRRMGYKVRYTNDHSYRIIWDKRNSRVIGNTFYYFKAARHIKRELAQCIKVDKIDYFI